MFYKLRRLLFNRYESRNFPSYVALSASLITICSVLIILSVFTPLGYDESYNLQVSSNIASYGDYATNGSLFEGVPKLFDPLISTGPTLLVPLALLFAIDTAPILQYRLICLLITILFFVLVWKIINTSVKNRNTKNVYFKLATFTFISAIIISLSSQNIFATAVGEPLALCFFIIACLFINNDRYAYAGTAIGLAILTKTVFLLSVPVFILILLKKYKKSLRNILPILLALLLPLIIFEFYRFYSFDFNLGLYKLNLKEALEFFKAGGSGATGSAGISQILFDKILSITHLNATTTSLFFVVPFVAIITWTLYEVYDIFRRITFTNNLDFIKNNNSLLLIGGTVVIWIGWWVIISDRAYGRHALPGIILLLVLLAVLFISKYRSTRYINTLTGSLVLASIAIFTAVILNTIKLPQPLSMQLADIERIEYIFKNKKLYHYGWWQNPEIQLQTGKTSYNYEQIPPGGVGYVPMSSLWRTLEPQSYSEISTRCKSKQVISTEYSICEVRIEEENK